MKQTTVLMLIALTCLAGGIGAQEALTVAPNGNVGINNANPDAQLDVVGNSELTGNLVVTGAVTVTGPVQAANITVLENSGVGIFSGMATIETTFPSRAATHKLIALPDRFTVENSFILTARMLVQGSDDAQWITLPYSDWYQTGADRWPRDLRLSLYQGPHFDTAVRGEYLLLHNAWNDTLFDNRSVRVVLAKMN